jgi:hypothetical protein
MPRDFATMVLAVAGLGVVHGCASPGSDAFRPSKSEFDSAWVEIAVGSATGQRGQGPALLLILKNKTDRALWVDVAFSSPDPARNCTIAKELSSRGSATYTCPQQQLVADVAYPVSVATFSDRALTQNLERKATKLQFKAADLVTFNKLLAPLRLPATFTDVWYRTDEVQVLIAYKEKGTLSVGADKLQFTHAKGTIEIPMASVKKVNPPKTMGMDIVNRWVVVEYRAPDKDALIAFKSAPFSGKSDDFEIYETIDWAFTKK